MASKDSNNLKIGHSLGHYRIISKIGAGGMGEVYLAHDTKLDRRVALKILPAEFAEDKDRMSRFVLEAKSASALNHPNIITIYEINEFAQTHFIATEFIDGKTLNEYVKSNPLNFKSSLEIGIQIASALDEAHSAGIVHRDIKPDNVMIRPNGLVKILDFGIAKLTGLNNQPNLYAEAATTIKQSTSPGMIIGTANYMSPEQATGKEVDARSDIFSFGVVLYEMMAAKLPFTGDTPVEMIGAILHKEPLPLNSDVPSEITKIIGKCLRKDRNERYQTVKDLLIDLKAALQKLEFEKKPERTISPEKEEPKTQLLKATTIDEMNQTTTNQTVANNPTKKYLRAALAILLVSVIGVFGYRYLATNHKQIESIAVMPFVNDSGNQDVEYLSDGMTETLIKSLSNLPNLNVKPRSSVFRYKGKDTDLQTIARELNVQAILNGRVVERGDQLIISLELVDAQKDSVIWTEQYNRKTSELVTLQSEIAKDVSTNLKPRLSGADEAKLADNGTTDSETYQTYLKGRYFISKASNDGAQQSLKYFQESVGLDPKFARGYAGIADAYTLLATVFASTVSVNEAMPKARTAAEKAIELDPNLGEAYTSLAWVKFRFDWDWAGAESAFKKAVALNPNYAQGHQWYGEYLTCMRREPEAVAEMKRARELEPFSLIINWNLAKTYVGFRRYDEALAEAKNVLELDKTFLRNYRLLRVAYLKKGMDAEAFNAAIKERELVKDPPEKITDYKEIFKTKGLSAALAKIAEFDLQNDTKNILAPLNKAYLYTNLGDKEKALYWLEEAYKFRQGSLVGLQAEVEFDSLRDEPRFQEIIRKMNFPK
jgi:serine/threonine protein kinase/Flp pilus assembly protein TadD